MLFSPESKFAPLTLFSTSPSIFQLYNLIAGLEFSFNPSNFLNSSSSKTWVKWFFIIKAIWFPSKNFSEISSGNYKNSLFLFAYFTKDKDWSHLNIYGVIFKDMQLFTLWYQGSVNIWLCLGWVSFIKSV